MNFKEWIRSLEVGVNRADLAADYPRYCNDALREICQRRSWRAMRTRGQVTIPANATSTPLPSDFKELVNERSPIEQVNGEGLAIPSDVFRREKLIRWDAWLLNGQAVYINTVTGRVPLQVFIDDLDGTPTLNVVRAQVSALLFNITYFRYLPDLAEDEDENGLTVNYPEMCKAKAKAIAFGDMNDDLAASFEQLFEAKFTAAAGQDAYSAIAGTVFRMGG